jgi:hypothetical protein
MNRVDVVMIGGHSPGIAADSVLRLRAEHVTGLEFDESTHTWTVDTAGGPCQCGVIISAGPAPAHPEGLRPYLGVAVHGRPNHFTITGPDVHGQRRYIADCLAVMARTGTTRIEVRYSTQRTFHERARSGPIPWRRLRRRIGSAFDLSTVAAVEPDLYDGPALLVLADRELDVRVRLTGHLDPIDGQYHWRGLIFGDLGEKLPQPAQLRVDRHAAAGRITERTTQGAYSISGTGAPPFALEHLEFSVPAL